MPVGPPDCRPGTRSVQCFRSLRKSWRAAIGKPYMRPMRLMRPMGPVRPDGRQNNGISLHFGGVTLVASVSLVPLVARIPAPLLGCGLATPNSSDLEKFRGLLKRGTRHQWSPFSQDLLVLVQILSQPCLGLVLKIALFLVPALSRFCA